MKKIILCFWIISFGSALKANTGSFLKPLREEFPTFVQTVEKETPLFIKVMDRKSLSKSQWFEQEALDTAVFSIIEILIPPRNHNINMEAFPYYYTLRLLRNLSKKFTEPFCFNLIKKILGNAITNLPFFQEVRILDAKNKDLFFFFFFHKAIYCYGEEFKLQFASKLNQNVLIELLMIRASLVVLDFYNKNTLKKRTLKNLKKEKKIFLKKLNLLIKENPQSVILQKIFLQASIF